MLNVRREGKHSQHMLLQLQTSPRMCFPSAVKVFRVRLGGNVIHQTLTCKLAVERFSGRLLLLKGAEITLRLVYKICGTLRSLPKHDVL